jgi:hypothetical protein
MDGPDALRRGSLETPVRRWGLALARMLDAWMCDPSQRKKKEQLKKSAMNDVHATNVCDVTTINQITATATPWDLGDW